MVMFLLKCIQTKLLENAEAYFTCQTLFVSLNGWKIRQNLVNQSINQINQSDNFFIVA